MNDGVWSIVNVISFWCYAALTPGLIVAIVVFGWLIPPKRVR